MKRDFAVTSIADELKAKAEQAAQHAAKVLDGRGEVVMTEINHPLAASALLDEAMIELAYARVMDKLQNPHMQPKREEWMATAPTPPNPKNAAAYPPMPPRNF